MARRANVSDVCLPRGLRRQQLAVLLRFLLGARSPLLRLLLLPPRLARRRVQAPRLRLALPLGVGRNLARRRLLPRGLSGRLAVRLVVRAASGRVRLPDLARDLRSASRYILGPGIYALVRYRVGA